MNINYQPLFKKKQQKTVSSNATVVTLFHVLNVHVNNTRTSFNSATLQ